ncbi:MAG: SAM-dependent methyltransferase [Desulfococcus sp. 4484_241]|nr:MAG: SAM-dependent methyltransferase [Desulfococcus sp. 4484_241]RLC30013.1 MAG: SAM-dependent methyltransferase [Deltaproteobacteria bacterium]
MVTADFSRLDIRPGYRILDIGCGEGRHLCAAYRLKGVTVFGADLNFDSLVSAREKLCFHDKLGEHGGGTWCLSATDITRLPFKDGYFDVVICSEVLEHIPNDIDAMREIIRVLKPAGDLVVSVPRYLPERICWALSDEYFNVNQGHVRIYREKELVERLEGLGVRRYARHFAHSLHSPYWWLKCLVGPKREDSRLVNLYHRFLTWDIMKKPRITRVSGRLLDPVMGKSLVLYLKKEAA